MWVRFRDWLIAKLPAKWLPPHIAIERRKEALRSLSNRE